MASNKQIQMKLADVVSEADTDWGVLKPLKNRSTVLDEKEDATFPFIALKYTMNGNKGLAVGRRRILALTGFKSKL